MSITRRDFIGTAAAATLASCGTGAPRSRRSRDGLPHSASAWCFQNFGAKWSFDKLCRVAVSLGMPGLDLVRPPQWPTLRKYGLFNSATPSHTFVRGMNNPRHWDECLSKLGDTIEANAGAGFPNVMTFTGFSDTTKEGGSRVDPDEGMRNCVDGYKKIVGLAEKKKVTLIMEPLNTRDPETAKGHPGFQGDHADYCIEIIRKVGSPSLKLLFDVYHIQIMDGDLVRRIGAYRDLIGHVQVAGVPGRGPCGPDQEIHYPAVVSALVKAGYTGYIAHEFIPVADPLRELRQSIAACSPTR